MQTREQDQNQGLVTTEEWLELVKEYVAEYRIHFLRNPFLRIEFQADLDMLNQGGITRQQGAAS